MTDQAISPLRRRMIEDMTIRTFAPKTQQLCVKGQFRCSPSSASATSTGPPGRSKPTFYGSWLDMAESALIRVSASSSAHHRRRPARQGKVQEVLESAIVAARQGFADVNSRCE
jgi:hypothetical protein